MIRLLKRVPKKNIVFSLLFVFLAPDFCFAQNAKPESNEALVYHYYNNGKSLNASLKLMMQDEKVLLLQGQNAPRFIDYAQSESIEMLEMEDSWYKSMTSFNELPHYETEEVDVDILGYPCTYAVGSLRSNRVEMWYTQSASLSGSPVLSLVMPKKNALVLRILINGSYDIRAEEFIQFNVDSVFSVWNPNLANAEAVDPSRFARLQIESRYKRFPVFEKQQINFGTEEPKSVEFGLLDTVYHFSKGTIVLRKVQLPDLKSGGQTFLRLSNRSLGDAYDRVGSVFMIPDGQALSMLDAFRYGLSKIPVFTANNGEEYQGIVHDGLYDPPVELMRFFTSFGAGHFNESSDIDGYNWPDSILYTQEITHLLRPEGQQVWLGAFIGNYDRGGHEINLELNFYPSYDTAAAKDQWMLPLFNTVNIMEMSGQNYGTLFLEDSLEVAFDVPEGLTDAQICLISTGHGGWEGGDEFNPKVNTIFLDNELLFHFVPWRSDCATYRELNPSSGNFANGLSSSDLSRSNWCPGTSTPPVFIPVPNLKPGKHMIKVAIPMGEREGQSFSSWNISAVLIGNLSE